MAVMISRAVHDAVIAAAVAQPSVEVCGLLFGASDVIDAHELTENVAPDPARHFEIDPGALLRASKAARNGGAPIAGYFHSHPNGLAEPSATDFEHAAGDGMLWAIVAGTRLQVWRSLPDGFHPEDLVFVD